MMKDDMSSFIIGKRNKMKKTLKTLILITLCCLSLTGCRRDDTTNTNGTTDNNNTTNQTDNNDGDLGVIWDDVKDEFDKITDDAKNSIDSLENLSKDDIKKLTTTIQEGYDKIKNGITKDNQDEARKVYEAASKLDYLKEKYENKLTDEEEDLLEVGDEAKELIMYYYGRYDDDYDDVKTDLENHLQNIKNYSDDKWNTLIDKLQ